MRFFAIPLLLGLTLLFPLPTLGQDHEKEAEPLVTGTVLYQWCGAAKEIRKDKDGHMSFAGDSTHMSRAMICLGYIRGVADSIELSDKPRLDADKRIERYFERVYTFLDEHPERRGESAANLVKEALRISK